MTATTTVLFVGAELTPLAKTGGLGDVMGALPKALHQQVHRLWVAIPFHEQISRRALPNLRPLTSVTIVVGDHTVKVSVWRTTLPGSTIPLLLFKNEDYLSRGGVYDGFSVLNPLSGKLCTVKRVGQSLRYLVFCFAVHEFIKQQRWPVQLVHSHDFHAAALLALLRNDPRTRAIKTMLTIHNLAYTGPTTERYLNLFNWNPARLFVPEELHRRGGARLLYLGIRWADKITTVSPQYAQEILTARYGNRFEHQLRLRRSSIHGILNGIDTTMFNPDTDPAVPTHFTGRTVAKRAANKLYLQALSGLPIHPDIPIIGFVARLSKQKGLDLIVKLMPELVKLPAQFVFCGTGNTTYVRALHHGQRRYPKQWHFHHAFDTVFSQQVYAGCDLFLMPSRHEPCGLAQLIAMRYGALPVVRATGGLKDTVHDGLNGFAFTKYSTSALLTTLQRAIKVYANQPRTWRRMMTAGMSADYSWEVSAKAYVRLYAKTIATR